MKNMIITMALVTLFAMLICFQWEMNSRSWQHVSSEGYIVSGYSVHSVCAGN